MQIYDKRLVTGKITVPVDYGGLSREGITESVVSNENND